MMSFPHPSDDRRRSVPRLAAAAAVACALSLACSRTPAADSSPRPAQPAPDVSSPPAEPDGSAATMPPDDPGPAVAPERRWQVFSGDLRFLDISSIPGFVIDTNAPPPPPNRPRPPRHPFLSASCGGDVMLCVRAGELLRASTSLDEFLAKLAAEGWRVVKIQPESSAP